MKPAILVTSHPNTDEKEYILKDLGYYLNCSDSVSYLVIK